MPIDEFLPKVNRPSRYLGGERGSIRKDPARTEVAFALAFPDVYEVGMSHLGFAILYHIVNALDWAAAERVFAPWPDMEAQLRGAGRPLASLESDRPLGDFDIVGFTLQYELSYSNVLNMLDLAGIPRRREERGDNHPLIVVGGPCAGNPEPLADFIDVAVIGDGEEAVVELLAAVRAAKQAGENRAVLLERLAKIEGVYVPAFFAVDYQPDGRIDTIRPLKPGYAGVRRRILPDLESAPFPTIPHCAIHEYRARPRGGGDRPWLHPWLPLLPGRLYLSAGARALAAEGDADHRWRPGRQRLRGGFPALPLHRRLWLPGTAVEDVDGAPCRGESGGFPSQPAGRFADAGADGRDQKGSQDRLYPRPGGGHASGCGR